MYLRFHLLMFNRHSCFLYGMKSRNKKTRESCTPTLNTAGVDDPSLASPDER